MAEHAWAPQTCAALSSGREDVKIGSTSFSTTLSGIIQTSRAAGSSAIVL